MHAAAAANTSPETILGAAIASLNSGKADSQAGLDALPAPLYTTDAEGVVTFANHACTDFAGRVPAVGQDRWCVTWKLYTDDGAFLPHDRCPMAVAIREKRPVRGVEAVAQRPDGSRVHFIPYPTPLTDREGNVVGAINLLIDITGRKQAEYLRAQASRCRRLARAVNDARTVDTLNLMAVEYEEEARAL